MNELSTRYGLLIDSRTFSDIGKSAFKGEQLENDLGRLINLINDGSIAHGSVIVIFSLDRLSRQHLTIAVSLLLNIITAGVGVHTTVDNRLYTDDSDTLMADLMMSLIAFAVANEESLKKSKRTKSAANQRLLDYKEGKLTPSNKVRWIGVGKRPMWVDVDEHKGIITNEHYSTLKLAVELSLAGHGSLHVAQILNQESSFKRDTSKLSKILRRASLMGRYKFKIDGVEHVLENYFPAICTEDEFYRLRQIKTQKARNRGVANFLPLLVGHGIFKHKQCNGGVRTAKSKVTGSVSYGCLNRSNGGSCIGFNIKAITIEKMVFKLITDTLFTGSQSVEQVSPIPRLESELTDKQNQLNEYVELLAEGGSPKAYTPLLARLENDIDSLNQELSEARIQTPIDTLLDDWMNVNQEALNTTEHTAERITLRQLIADTCENVEIDKQTKQRDFTLTIKLKDGQTGSVLFNSRTKMEEIYSSGTMGHKLENGYFYELTPEMKAIFNTDYWLDSQEIGEVDKI